MESWLSLSLEVLPHCSLAGLELAFLGLELAFLGLEMAFLGLEMVFMGPGSGKRKDSVA